MMNAQEINFLSWLCHPVKEQTLIPNNVTRNADKR